MNKKGVIIGKTITDFISLIIVLVFIVIFVIISGFISNNNSNEYNLLDDFLDDIILFKGEPISVNKAIEDMCKDESLESTLRVILQDHFIQKYGKSNAFVVVYSIDGYGNYILSIKVGVFEDLVLEKGDIRFKVSPKQFWEIFDENSPKYKIDSCTIFVKSGGINES